MTRRTALALAGVVILLVLILAAPAAEHSRLLGTLHDTAHGGVFAAIGVLCMLALREMPRLRGSAARQYALALVASAILGAATELLQVPLERDASAGDFGNDLLGAMGGLAAFAAFDRSVKGIVRVRSALGALLLAAVLAAPLATALAAYARRHASFPAIADFSRRFDAYFLVPQWATIEHARLPDTWARYAGERAARIVFEEGAWPGVYFAEPVPDWRGHAVLALDVTNPSASALPLVLRVHDAAHDQEYEDRFNRTLSVAPRSRAVLRIALSDIEHGPARRLLDLHRVAGILVFLAEGSRAREMYVSGVWLEEAARPSSRRSVAHRDHGPDRLAASHQLESLVDPLERQAVRDQ